MSLDINVLKNNLTTPQRTFKWEFDIPSPKGSGGSDLWNVRAVSTNEPEVSFEEIVVEYKGTEGFVVPGRKRNTHQFTVTLIESEDGKTLDAITSWMELIRSGLTGAGVPDPMLKTDVIISKFGTDNTVTKRIKMKGAWIKKKGETTFAQNANEVQMYEVTFAFDQWVVVD